MEAEQMINTALTCGFTDAVIISTEEFHFVPEYRHYCEENRCGNYGRNYGCPPACGTVEEMKERALAYRKGLVLRSLTPVDNAYDEEETKAIKKAHTRMTNVLIRRLKEEGMNGSGMAIMAGPCNLCSSCRMPEGKSCPHGKAPFSCLSAYCIDAMTLAKSAGIEMEWSMDEVSFFSIYLFDRKTSGPAGRE
ncbi:MAG: DUF2284 domain-containing protein [Lachnospiraceae bacterium]|nr:DUF2284 domain-containing protein [Lachnospiraceae bacterium]